MSDDLIKRLRDLAECRHSDLSVAAAPRLGRTTISAARTCQFTPLKWLGAKTTAAFRTGNSSCWQRMRRCRIR